MYNFDSRCENFMDFSLIDSQMNRFGELSFKVTLKLCLCRAKSMPPVPKIYLIKRFLLIPKFPCI
jgi:hypothetical protein